MSLKLDLFCFYLYQPGSGTRVLYKTEKLHRLISLRPCLLHGINTWGKEIDCFPVFGNQRKMMGKENGSHVEGNLGGNCFPPPTPRIQFPFQLPAFIALVFLLNCHCPLLSIQSRSEPQTPYQTELEKN